MYKTFITIISNNFDSKEYQKIKDFFDSKGFNIEGDFPGTNWNPPYQYIEEMGPNLETRIIFFNGNKNKEQIILLNKYSQDLEKKDMVNNKRVFNINPGFLSENGMYLLSHKPNEARGRLPFGVYFIEKQYDKDDDSFMINHNTFSEYIEIIDLFNNYKECA